MSKLKTIKSKLDIQYKKRGVVNNKIYDLEQAVYAIEELPRLKKLLGRCFRYRNSSGGNRRWWVYIRVIGIDSSRLILQTYAKDTDGRITAEIFKEHMHSSKDWFLEEEITAKKFKSAISGALNDIEKFISIEVTDE